MKPSMSGHWLPESLQDFEKLNTEKKLRYRSCKDCGHVFSDETVNTAAGWRETQISGLCEVCFDELFQETT